MSSEKLDCNQVTARHQGHCGSKRPGFWWKTRGSIRECNQSCLARISVYEADIASLIQRHQCDVEPLLQRLQPHLEAGDLHELREIVRDIQARIARFDQFKKP